MTRRKLLDVPNAKIVKLYESTGSVHRMAPLLQCSPQVVLNRLHEIGVDTAHPNPPWTEKETQLLRDLYNTEAKPDINFIAQVLHKTRAAVACKANDLKLTDGSKPVRTETHRKMISNHLAGGRPGYPSNKHGRRVDLNNQFFRSAWEANVARYLTYMHRRWAYESKTFWFEAIRRGVRSYTPDFYLPDEDLFIEVKGYMDQRSRTTLNRMRIYHPTICIEVWDRKRYFGIRSTVAHVIPNWE